MPTIRLLLSEDFDMYLETFGEIVSRLESDKQKLDEYESYLEEMNKKIDFPIVDVITDNRYVNCVSLKCDFLLEKLLGVELKEWVDWYLYDRQYDKADECNAWIHDIGYSITDFESFMNFAQHGLKLPMKPKCEDS